MLQRTEVEKISLAIVIVLVTRQDEGERTQIYKKSSWHTRHESNPDRLAVRQVETLQGFLKSKQESCTEINTQLDLCHKRFEKLGRNTVFMFRVHTCFCIFYHEDLWSSSRDRRVVDKIQMVKT
jgi:hypothetical protein